MNLHMNYASYEFMLHSFWTTLDWTKSCDVAEAYAQNNVKADVCLNQIKKLKNVPKPRNGPNVPHMTYQRKVEARHTSQTVFPTTLLTSVVMYSAQYGQRVTEGYGGSILKSKKIWGAETHKQLIIIQYKIYKHQ